MDIRINNEKEHFKFRVCGILTHNGKFLAARMNSNTFYCFPGGHTEIGEDTETAVQREMLEEIGFEVNVKSLTAIAQNLYTSANGDLFHELSYYYLVEAKNIEDLNPQDYEVLENDKGVMKKIEFKWLTKEQLINSDCRPGFINKILNPNKVLHIISKFGEDTKIEEFNIKN